MQSVSYRRGWTAAAICGALVMAGTMVGGPTAAAREASILYADSPYAIEDSYIVVLEDGPAARSVDATVSSLATRYSATVRHTYRSALTGFSATMSEQQARQLAADAAVAYVEQDRSGQFSADQTNPPSWGIDRIDQRNYPPDGNYNYLYTGSNVRAYIIDTGIRITHDDFGNRASYGRDVYDDDGNASDCYGHGTHVAGTVGGAAHGVAKGVRLVAIKASSCSGATSLAVIIAGVDWVTANHVKPAVANMSVGFPPSTALDNAVRNSIAAGITYVVAAGNSDDDACQRSPARVDEAITVGATDRNDRRADFSSFGECLDLFAPGVDIRSTLHTSDTAAGNRSGTSMAAPHATGAAAMYMDLFPIVTPELLSVVLRDFSTPNEVADPGTGSPNRLLYRVKTPTVTRLVCRSVPIRVMNCSTGYTAATAPITVRWYRNGAHVPAWDNQLSISGICTTSAVTVQVRLTAGNGSDRATDIFNCRTHG